MIVRTVTTVRLAAAAVRQVHWDRKLELAAQLQHQHQHRCLHHHDHQLQRHPTWRLLRLRAAQCPSLPAALLAIVHEDPDLPPPPVAATRDVLRGRSEVLQAWQLDSRRTAALAWQMSACRARFAACQ